MKSLLNLMEKEEIADKMHKQARISLVAYLNPGDRERELVKIYGENFSKAEAFPLEENKGFIKLVLSQINLKEAHNSLVIEEYRRLERVLDYQRRTFCLDLEGLLINDKKLTSGIEDVVFEIRKKHNIVVSTAMPKKEALDLIYNTKLNKLLVFGDLTHPKGKKYNPIVEFFGYPHPEKQLVAVGHSFEDTPADIDIPFIYLDVDKNELSQALIESVEFLDNKIIKNYEILEGAFDSRLKKFYLVSAR